MPLSLKIQLRKLISDSNTHSAFRVLIAMVLTFIPNMLQLSIPYLEMTNLHISISLCLGVMASAVIEHDANYRTRQKFLATILSCFFIASVCVELLMPYPILFALGLLISSFIFLMLGAIDTTYSKVGFGAILIAIYTMIGYQQDSIWYEQPLLLTLGALCYGLFSILWSIYSPNRSLREQIAQLFFTLSRYQRQKSSLFNEKEGGNQADLFKIRQQLAIINISIVARLNNAKHIIQSGVALNTNQTELKKLNHYYLIAEQIHERICASQYLYSQLEIIFGQSQILEGYHQLLLELSEDCYQLGININDKKTYQHSRRLTWTINALSDQLYLLRQKLQHTEKNHEAIQALQAIYDNLQGIDELLIKINKFNVNTIKITFEKEVPLLKNNLQLILSAMHPRNSVFRHAVRISISLLLAYALQHVLHLAHGFWLLLTVLFVCQPSYSETRKRLIQRTLGTLIGILLCYPALFFLNSILLQIIAMIISAFFFFSYVRTNYALGVVFITLFVMFVFTLLTGNGLAILPARIGETLLGGALSVLAISFIFPDWQFLRFPFLVQQVLNHSEHYFKKISLQYQQGRSENLAYRISRTKIFQADASLTSAWQSMLFEPSSKQKLNREVYALVNRCDALVSYIAALASHRHKIEDIQDSDLLHRLMNTTLRQIIWANHIPIQRVDKYIMQVDDFDKCKIQISPNEMLIVEQLRLIAFTALDIKTLLIEVDFNIQNN